MNPLAEELESLEDSTEFTEVLTSIRTFCDACPLENEAPCCELSCPLAVWRDKAKETL